MRMRLFKLLDATWAGQTAWCSPQVGCCCAVGTPIHLSHLKAAAAIAGEKQLHTRMGMQTTVNSRATLGVFGRHTHAH